MKKLIFLFALMAVFILALAACGSDEAPINNELATDEYEANTYSDAQHVIEDEYYETTPADVATNTYEDEKDSYIVVQHTVEDANPQTETPTTTPTITPSQTTTEPINEPAAPSTTTTVEPPVIDEPATNQQETTAPDNVEQVIEDAHPQVEEPTTTPPQPAEEPVVEPIEEPVATTTTTILNVSGINCGRCSTAIRNAVNRLDGSISVSVDIRGGVVTVEHYTRLDVATISNTIVEEGFVVN